jgi:OOP family OmpA-OmpF porin
MSALGALGALGATGSPVGAAAPSGYKIDIRDLKGETRDYTFRVESMDGRSSDVRTPTQVTVTLSADVLFAFDKAELTPAAEAALGDLAPKIAREAKGTVKIDGYTDAKGEVAYNQDLSERRATAVETAIEARLGGTPVTFVATGHGARDFVAPNAKPDGSDDPDGRAKNRRVTITYEH